MGISPFYFSLKLIRKTWKKRWKLIANLSRTPYIALFRIKWQWIHLDYFNTDICTTSFLLRHFKMFLKLFLFFIILAIIILLAHQYCLYCGPIMQMYWFIINKSHEIFILITYRIYNGNICNEMILSQKHWVYIGYNT